MSLIEASKKCFATEKFNLELLSSTLTKARAEMNEGLRENIQEMKVCGCGGEWLSSNNDLVSQRSEFESLPAQLKVLENERK